MGRGTRSRARLATFSRNFPKSISAIERGESATGKRHGSATPNKCASDALEVLWTDEDFALASGALNRPPGARGIHIAAASTMVVTKPVVAGGCE